MPRTLSLLPVTAVLAAVLAVTGCSSSAASDDGRIATNQAPNPAAARTLEPTPAPPSVGALPKPADSGEVTFSGVTVTHAFDVDTEPGITTRQSAPAPGLLVQDLVVGTGAAATPTSTATLHYKGVLYSNGTVFDSDYDNADPAPQSLGKAISGFAQGVGGTDGVPPMRTGGRRLMVFPAALGYGPVPLDKIPAHASLVFVVDLLAVS